ncbi:hypothetical protein EJB05_30565, partial [Eragrostis curvula]
MRRRRRQGGARSRLRWRGGEGAAVAHRSEGSRCRRDAPDRREGRSRRAAEEEKQRTVEGPQIRNRASGVVKAVVAATRVVMPCRRGVDLTKETSPSSTRRGGSHRRVMQGKKSAAPWRRVRAQPCRRGGGDARRRAAGEEGTRAARGGGGDARRSRGAARRHAVEDGPRDVVEERTRAASALIDFSVASSAMLSSGLAGSCGTRSRRNALCRGQLEPVRQDRCGGASGWSQDPSSGLTAFALRLAKQFAKGDGEGKGKNLVFSPLSIYAVLALVAAGARGETLDELLNLLGAESRDELAEFVCQAAESAPTDCSEWGGPLIAYTCGVWHERMFTLNSAYRAAAMELYKAETRAVDFLGKAEEAREEINNWVSNATNKLIPTILPEGSMHSRTTLVLGNAIYFKGMWSKPFAEKDTRKKRFYRLDGSHVRAPFMHSRMNQFVEEHDGFKVLKLPYLMEHPDPRRGRLQFPNEGSGQGGATTQAGPGVAPPVLPDARDGLPSLLEEIASSPSFLQDHLPSESVKVGEFRLPKFKLSFFIQMEDVLKEMGIEAAFEETKAEFPDMLEREGGDGLFLEHVFHKAVIEVNEEGTEAAASTMCIMARKCAPTIRKPVDFIADHPFVFFLMEEDSGAIVFMGQVLDPTESE